MVYNILNDVGMGAIFIGCFWYIEIFYIKFAETYNLCFTDNE